jgi:hypothetical protein
MDQNLQILYAIAFTVGQSPFKNGMAVWER